jgi:hypothetical protein
MKFITGIIICCLLPFNSALIEARVIQYSHAGVQVDTSNTDSRDAPNVLDGTLDPKRRWTADDNGEFLQFDFGMLKNLEHIDIAFYDGDMRFQFLTIDVASSPNEWHRVYSGCSSAKSLGWQRFKFAPQSAQFVRITGHGMQGMEWMSLTEVKFGFTPSTTFALSSSDDDGHAVAKAVDGSLKADSRWSSQVNGSWMQFDFQSQQVVKGIDIVPLNGDTRVQYFAIELATNAGEWQRVYSGPSRQGQRGYQHFGFAPTSARYLRIKGYGSADDTWTALLEVRPILDRETPLLSLPLGTTYHVSPDGNDNNNGTTNKAPKRTIQAALNLANSGDRVLLGAGHYLQDVVSVRSGTLSRPIIIEGPSTAIIQGSGRSSHVFDINHDHLHLQGFTVDGKVVDANGNTDYREKLIYVHGKEVHRGPSGLLIQGMTFRNAAGECLRLRYFIRWADVGFNHFENCGVDDFQLNGGSKNGEAIYLGTSSTQWGDGKNPSSDADVSAYNRIHHNTFITRGNECIEIKEGSRENLLEYNDCSGQRDPNSGGYGVRGDANIIRYNKSWNNKGAGIRIGGHTVDGQVYGTNNSIYNNQFQDNDNGTIKFQVSPQAQVCENFASGSIGLEHTGSDQSLYRPNQSCSS